MMSINRYCNIKYGALALLVLQNTFLVLLMYYSRSLKSGPLYSSSTAVVSMEILKFISCIFVLIFENKSIFKAWKTINDEILQKPTEIMKLAVPSLLYAVQNNLLYFALSNLDAATFQVGYQLKILTTALFSVLMLGKKLSLLQWISLIALTVGVSMVQLASKSNKSHQRANNTVGFIAVFLAACTSGFSGVYFEKILKNSITSLWVRNVQMGISSVLLGFSMIYFSGELPIVLDKGFFYGYNAIVIWVIILQAIGGLVVAVVVKYADNILKGFAASFSIVTSCILSYFFLDFRPNLIFILGAVLVNVSMYLYSYSPPLKDKVGGDNQAPKPSNKKDEVYEKV